MSNEVAIYATGEDIVVSRPPDIVLAEAQRAAKALSDVVSKKKKPIIMQGEQYLEFEDWQTVGKFYGITAKVISTEYIEYGDAKGFQARAAAIRTTDGMEISAAEAMCLNDEANWKGKPLFQLRSMAQTRACAKALRNVLAWVVVLAGYRPTPAEEIQDMAQTRPPISPPQPKQQQSNPQPQQHGKALSTEKQQKAIHALAAKVGIPETELFIEINGFLREGMTSDAERMDFSPVGSTTELTTAQASKIIAWLGERKGE